jgi:hypothetical protein
VLSAEHSAGSTEFTTSEIVSIPFFYGNHRNLDADRGPYKHSQDWLVARLQPAHHDAEKILVKEDKSDKEFDDKNTAPSTPGSNSKSKFKQVDPASIMTRISRLKFLIPKTFPPTHQPRNLLPPPPRSLKQQHPHGRLPRVVKVHAHAVPLSLWRPRLGERTHRPSLARMSDSQVSAQAQALSSAAEDLRL